MAIAKVSTSSGPNSNATSTTVTLPTGFNSAGNITILSGIQGVVSYAFQPTAATMPVITGPSGWTTLVNSGGAYCFYRLWQGGDPSSVTVTSTLTDWFSSACITYSGVDTTNPIDASNSCFIASNFSDFTTELIRASPVNPNYTTDQLVCVFLSGYINGGALSLPSGLTSEVSYTAGPSILIADAALSTANQTAYYNTTALSGAYLGVGIQIALKTSGASPTTQAACTPIFGGMLPLASNAAVTSFTVFLDHFNPQTGDLIAVFLTGGSVSTLSGGPSGYMQQASVSSTYLYTHGFTAGDNTAPAWTFGSNTWVTGILAVIRASGGAVNPSYEASVTASSGTTTVTIGTQTPSTANDMLICYYGDTTTTAGTFGNPSGLTVDFVNTSGPNCLMGWVVPAASPTGTFASTDSRSGSTPQGIGALFTLAPTTLSASISESGSASDSVNFTGSTFLASVSESGSASDNANSYVNAGAAQYIFAGLPTPVFLNETGTSEYVLTGFYVNENAIGPYAVSIVETGAASDSVNEHNSTYVGVDSESGSASDSVHTAASTYVGAISETGAASDTVTTSAAYSVSIAETGSTSDTTDASEIDSITLSGVQMTSAVGVLTTQKNAIITLTGIASTPAIGTPTVTISSNPAITGVVITSSIGVLTPDHVIALTGVSITSAISAPTVRLDGNQNITGVVIASGIGTPTVSIGVSQPHILGVQAQTATGSLSTSITAFLSGVASTPAVGTPTIQVGPGLVGQQINSAVGVLVAESANALTGVQTNAVAGNLLVTSGVNATNVTLEGVSAELDVGILGKAIEIELSGVEANAGIGQSDGFTFLEGFSMTDIVINAIPQLGADVGITMRYSNTGGQTWSNPVTRSLGFIGQYDTNLSWRNQGPGRSMVYEISWACPFRTSIGGATILIDISET